MKKYFNKVSAITGLSLLPLASLSYAAIDVSSIATDITAVVTAIATIAMAILGVLVSIKAYKFVQRAL